MGLRRAARERKADIADADIVVATMLFLEDHIRAVLPALRRGATNASHACCFSAGEVMRLTVSAAST
jgi:magnesium chelatase subunit H